MRPLPARWHGQRWLVGCLAVQCEAAAAAPAVALLLVPRTAQCAQSLRGAPHSQHGAMASPGDAGLADSQHDARVAMASIALCTRDPSFDQQKVKAPFSGCVQWQDALSSYDDAPDDRSAMQSCPKYA